MTSITVVHQLLLFILILCHCNNGCWAFFQEVQESGKRNWRGVAASSDGTRQAAVVLGGSIWLSQDSGASWNEHDNVNISSNPWMAITSSSSGEYLMAANFDEGIWVSSDYGLQWYKTQEKGAFQDVACSSDGKFAVAAINNGFIYTSDDYGEYWSDDNNAGWRFWTAVASDSTGQYLIAILNDYIYTSQDYGKVWTPMYKEGIWNDCASDSTGQYLVIVENGGYIYTSNDYGSSWNSNDSPYEYWYSVASTSDGQLLFAGADSVDVYASDDYGSTWYRNYAGNQKWWSLATNSDGDIAIAGAYDEYLYVGQNPTLTEKLVSCFAVDSTLTLRNGKLVAIDDIKVGDEVLSIDRYGMSSFSPVVVVPHAKNKLMANFVYFLTEKGRDLKLSADHLIMYSPSCRTNDMFLHKASDLVSGGCVVDEKNSFDVIKDIEIKKGRGVYTVVTMKEYIVVNGLTASPFAASHIVGSLFYDCTFRFLFKWCNIYLGETNWTVMTFLDTVTEMSEKLLAL